MRYKAFDDEMLVRSLEAGDGNALEEIYRRYSEKLFFAALKKVRSRDIAEELVQKLFVNLWEKRAALDIQRLEAYLQSAIRYQVINYIKSTIIREKYLQHNKQQLTEGEDSGESLLLLRELSVAIDDAINKLPQKTQEIFRLSRYEKWPVKEIARFMNLSEKAVEYHVTQSLKFIRLRLKDYITLLLPLLINFSYIFFRSI